jgi:hypothetical protein
MARVQSPSGGGATAVWTRSRLVVWGGDRTNTGGIYDPAKDIGFLYLYCRP